MQWFAKHENCKFVIFCKHEVGGVWCQPARENFMSDILKVGYINLRTLYMYICTYHEQGSNSKVLNVGYLGTIMQYQHALWSQADAAAQKKLVRGLAKASTIYDSCK